jgi:hypothetical protein
MEEVIVKKTSGFFVPRESGRTPKGVFCTRRRSMWRIILLLFKKSDRLNMHLVHSAKGFSYVKFT